MKFFKKSEDIASDLTWLSIIVRIVTNRWRATGETVQCTYKHNVPNLRVTIDKFSNIDVHC